MYKVGIITLSDAAYRGEREDISGKVIEEIVKAAHYSVLEYTVLPDEKDQIQAFLIKMSDELELDLVVTTGGTGFSQRDVTPEATKAVILRDVPGIAEAIRSYSMTLTKRAMLSRGVSGIRNNTLIVNLPGSPKACREALEYILPELKHGLDILKGSATNCARK